MGKTRETNGSCWDALAWKTVDVQLEQDDGWNGNENDDRCLFGALEEIDGNSFSIEKDVSGNMLVSINRPSENGAAKSSISDESSGLKKRKRKNKQNKNTLKDEKIRTEAIRIEALQNDIPIEQFGQNTGNKLNNLDMVKCTESAGQISSDCPIKPGDKHGKKYQTKKLRREKNKLCKKGNLATDSNVEMKNENELLTISESKDTSLMFEELSDQETAQMMDWISLGTHIHPALLRGLHKLNFFTPTDIQKRTLAKAIMSGRDIVGAAETGSGKTLAYGLPILNSILRINEKSGILKDNERCLLALIICPTRELALQVTKHLAAVSEGTGIDIVSIVGGLAEVKQIRLLKRRPPIVVATPGRFWEMHGTHPYLKDMSKLNFLVIDEADKMCEKGRFDELGKLMRAISPNPENEFEDNVFKSLSQETNVGIANKQVIHPDLSWIKDFEWKEPEVITEEQKEPKKNSEKMPENSGQALEKSNRQTFIFSATLSMNMESDKVDKKMKRQKGVEANLDRIMKLVGLGPKPVIVDLSRNRNSIQGSTVEDEEDMPPPALPQNLSLAQVKSLQMDKDAWLYLFVSQFPGRTLVFVNAIMMARRVVEVLRLLRVPCFALHAQMQQRQRLKALDHLREHSNYVVVATDVAARGLDIPSVDHVVHYDVPRTPSDFVHRSGRTARSGKTGFVLCIISPRDDQSYTRVFKSIGYPTGLASFPYDPRWVDKAKERAALASKVARCETAKGKVGATKTFMTSLADEGDMEADEEALEFADPENGGMRGGKKAAKLAAKAMEELQACLSCPFYVDKRKFLPVADKLADMELKSASELTVNPHRATRVPQR